MADKKNGSEPQKSPGGMSKKDAVRRALSDLGNEAKPMQIQGHIKQRYHIDMGLDHISTCKGEILREAGQAKPTAGKPASAKPSSKQPSAPKLASGTGKAATAQDGGSPGISLKDIETVKDLVERVGATSLKKLIDVMAR